MRDLTICDRLAFRTLRMRGQKRIRSLLSIDRFRTPGSARVWKLLFQPDVTTIVATASARLAQPSDMIERLR